MLLDVVEGVPFYVDELLFQYLRAEQITLDVADTVSDSFSLESVDGMHFVTRATSCTAETAQ